MRAITVGATAQPWLSAETLEATPKAYSVRLLVSPMFCLVELKVKAHHELGCLLLGFRGPVNVRMLGSPATYGYCGGS